MGKWGDFGVWVKFRKKGVNWVTEVIRLKGVNWVNGVIWVYGLNWEDGVNVVNVVG